MRGIPGFFSPRLPAWDGLQAKVGLDAASYYSTAPLRETLAGLVDPEILGKDIRLTVFGVNVWQPTGVEPESIWQVLGRQKDIQYASRADSHIARQKQIHQMRHIIRELEKNLSPERKEECRELAAWGCGTVMHVVRLLAPALDGEDYMKALDFSAAGIRFRREAGLADARRMIERAPWEAPVDPMEGVI